MAPSIVGEWLALYTTNAIESITTTQDHQDSRALHKRRCRNQANLAGAAQHHRRLGRRDL